MTQEAFSVHDFNRSIIEEFRANNGSVGGMFEGARLLLLTTTGARSGRKHTTPVGYLPDGERSLIIASAGGAPQHPAWFHNLRAEPRVVIENGAFSYEADAEVLEGEERDAMFSRAAEADPGWAEYQAKTDRTIPVVALKPVGAPADDGRGLGDSLIAIHDAFRRELAILREELARSGTGLGAQLRVNCLTMCQGLNFHHTAEDNGIFPALAQSNPELSEVIDRLGEEHGRVHELLEQIQERIGDADADPATVLSDVDTLVTDLEAHLSYEEEQLVPVLNTITP